MEARYLTNENGERVGVVLSVEEYEKLVEGLEELEDVEHVRAAERTRAAIEHGEEEVIPWEEVRGKIGSEYEGPE